MRPERLILLAALAGLAAGCTNVDDWSGMKRRKDTTPVTQTDDGALVADYLATLDRLGRGGAAQQAEIIESTRSAYLEDPSTRKRLRYAFVLSVPGHAASDPPARARCSARPLRRQKPCCPPNAPSPTSWSATSTRGSRSRARTNRCATAARRRKKTASPNSNRRLQAETAEKDRLRRELERAEAKLEAIATLEGGATPQPRHEDAARPPTAHRAGGR